MNYDDKLIYMANQIAQFFAAQGEKRGAKGVADHIKHYWTGDMRERFAEITPQKKEALHPLVLAALPLIFEKAA